MEGDDATGGAGAHWFMSARAVFIHNSSRRYACIPGLALALVLLLGPYPSQGDILYVSTVDNTIEKFDLATGAALGVFGHSELCFPTGLAFDKAGNVFVASTLTNKILRFTLDGAASVFASTGLHWPEGLAFDRQGNLYVANSGNNTVVKFTPDGVGSVFASTGLSSPMGLAFDDAGNLYVANYRYYLNRDVGIIKFTPDGIGSVFARTGLNYPVGLAFDSAGNLYVANQYSEHIEKFAPTGADLGVFASTGLSSPIGLAIDGADNLYVANQTWYPPGYITKISPDGVCSVFANTVSRLPMFIAIKQVHDPTPMISCSPPVILECADGAAVGTVYADVLDTNGYPLEVVWTVDGTPYQTNQIPAGLLRTASNVTFTSSFALGEHLVEVSASNGQTNAVTCSTTVTVRDTAPPQIARIVATPSVLWPPNRRMVPVSITVDAVDNCDPSPVVRITEVTSNEPEEPYAPDWEIAGPLSVNLRAHRLGKGAGRIYTIVVRCEDASGNFAFGSVAVTVRHDIKRFRTDTLDAFTTARELSGFGPPLWGTS